MIERCILDPGPVGVFGFTGSLLTTSLLFLGVNDQGPVLRAFDKATGEIVQDTALPMNPPVHRWPTW